MKYDYIASIELSADLNLSEAADKLTNVFNGFVFEEDVSDRFDEIPAYIAVLDDIELILMGPPDDFDEADYYLLKLYCKKKVDLGLYHHYGCEFLNSLPREKVKIEESGYVDVSLNLMEFVNSTQEFKCALME